jgi:hypothetical protein
MHQFSAGRFFDVSRVVTQWTIKSRGDSSVISKHTRETNAGVIAEYIPSLNAVGMAASCATLEKICELLRKDDATWSDFTPLGTEFIERLVDEGYASVFFALSPRESNLFRAPRQGWTVAIERFPSIVDDVEEASKCLALSRYTAAVFHSVQIIEAGLIELGGFLKVSDPQSGWTAVALSLKKIIERSHKDRTRFERKNFKFLEQIYGTIEGLKNAWRNKISHAHGKMTVMTVDFSPDVAEEILFASRAFMRRLAEGLPPLKQRKVSPLQELLS